METSTPVDLLDRPTGSTTLGTWIAAVRTARRHGLEPAAMPGHFVALSARLGIDLTFDDLGYEARFTVAATGPIDAAATAQRRWFYLADDLGLPNWPVTDLTVVSIEA